MDIALEEYILAIVALRSEEKAVSSAMPIFWADTADEAQHLCLLLSRVLKGMSHDLENGTFIIVRH